MIGILKGIYLILKKGLIVYTSIAGEGIDNR